MAQQDGKQMMTSHSVRYQDSYQKVNGKWLIAKRIANFMITDTRELATANH